jgi:hypothetical protein
VPVFPPLPAAVVVPVDVRALGIVTPPIECVLDEFEPPDPQPSSPSATSTREVQKMARLIAANSSPGT